MKNVQTKIGEVEYSLLKRKAGEENKTIQQVLREAIEEYLVRERIDPKDALFSEPVAEKGAKDGSLLHDKYVYGGK